MVIEQEIETYGPEVPEDNKSPKLELIGEDDPEIEYIRNLSEQLKADVDRYLADRPSVPLNLEDLKTKLELYKSGNFKISEVDFACLDRAVNFTVKRLHNGNPDEVLEKLRAIRDGK